MSLLERLEAEMNEMSEQELRTMADRLMYKLHDISPDAIKELLDELDNENNY